MFGTKCFMAAGALVLAATTAQAFDLEAHRGGRGLMPENTLAAFASALSIGVTTLELDLGLTKDGVLVVSHDRALNPDHTRGPDDQFLDMAGPAIRSLTLAELKRYDIGRLKPNTAYAKSLPEQRAVDGATIPTLAEVFALVDKAKAGYVRFNIETKLTPTANDAADQETFAPGGVQAVREAGLASRTMIQSYDWRTLMVARKISPEIERACITIDRPTNSTLKRGEPGPSPWTAGLDIDDFGGSAPRLVQAGGCAVWLPFFRDLTDTDLKEAKALGLKVIPWTVNEDAEMEWLMNLGVDGLITDYPDRLRALMATREMPLPPQVPQAPGRD
jgi:glycerophosphoryl diester phosphodiesterase